ncbi:MAG: DUF6443 domain-containing protein [Bacteroidia bacterium]
MNNTIRKTKWRIAAGIWMTWAMAGSLTAQSVNQNFVQTETVNKPVKTESALNALSDMEDKCRVVEYYDGLGKHIQRVEVQASTKAKDQVIIQSYDAYGRNVRSYLPYETTSGNNGNFRSNAVSEQDAYFDLMGLIAPADRDYPFADQIFEPSSLNRVIEQGAPGFDWQPAQGHTKKFVFRTNDLSQGIDAVKRWDYAPATDQFVAAGNYAANSLFVEEAEDENGHKKISYKDKTGRTILVRVEINTTTTATNPASWANTGYFYDQKGNLRIILQPEGMNAVLSNGGNLYAGTIMDNFAFSYQYDERSRLIAQKAPGAGWKYFVYNPLDQVVLTQDAALRAQNAQFWLFSKYDHMGRPVINGLFQNTGNLTRDQLQASIRTNMENGQQKAFEARSPLNFDQNQGYTNQAFPQIVKELHTVTWYDHYDFNLDGIADRMYTFEPETPDNTAFYRAADKQTGSRAWILNKETDMPDSLLTVIFYDERGREIQSLSENHLGGVELLTRKYNFSGHTTRKVHRHTDANRNYAVINDITFDHRGQQLTTTQTNELDGVKDSPVIISSLEYDALGRLSERNLHSVDQGLTFTQSIDYGYNIRNWLTDINQINPACSATGSGELGSSETEGGLNGETSMLFGDDNTIDIFGMRLLHNTGFTSLNGTAAPQYTGNISGMIWQTASDCDVKGYGFQYDHMERMQNAWFAVEGTGGVWNQQLNRYSVNDITYDRNGNIQKLKRKGKTGASTFGLIDDLTYTYSGNKLLKVKDKVTSSFSSLGIDHFYDGNPTTNDYYYDAAGNIVTDNNKGTTVTYNHLSKPVKIQYSNGSRIDCIYDAGGNKLRQKVTAAGTTNTEDLVNGFFYKNQELAYFIQQEGRVNFVNQAAFEYQYNITDHLGNVRASFRPDALNDWVIVQEDHYYPFGMRMGGKSYQSGMENDIRFNGKSLVSDLNVDLYDYGFRWYMPDIGRFVSVDPLTDKYTYLTPYQFAENTPIQAVDMDGLESVYINIDMTLFDNFMANLISAEEFYKQLCEMLKNGTPQGQVESVKGLYEFAVALYEDPGAIARQIKDRVSQTFTDLGSTDPAVAGKAIGKLKFFTVELVAGSKAVSALGNTSKATQVIVAATEEAEGGFIILYRGQESASKVIKSYAAQENGYAYSQKIIETSNLDDLMMKHALDSRTNKSPFISASIDPAVAEHFAGPTGTVHVLRVPVSRAIPNPHNSFTIPGGASEAEYLIPNYIRLSEFITP